LRSAAQEQVTSPMYGSIHCVAAAAKRGAGLRPLDEKRRAFAVVTTPAV